MKRVLVIAYYFPPMGLSGVQRVAKFVKYLPEYGWEVEVLTVHPGGYFAFDRGLEEEVNRSGATVHRTFSWDPTRLFGRQKTVGLPAEPTRNLLSKIGQLVFVPDNKIGWFIPAIRKGKSILRSKPFDAIFVSAPPYTAHLIGAYLSKWSGIRLVTDFRDDWVGNPRHWYPTRLHRAINQRLEKWVLGRSSVSTTINDHIRDSLLERNGETHPDVRVLPQGFDPDDFDGQVQANRSDGKMRLVYTGVFYDVQTPDTFLRALAALISRRPDIKSRIEVVFVGLVPPYMGDLVKELGLDTVVKCTGYLEHHEVVEFLIGADALWLTVGKRPGSEGISTGKLYEYVGTRKPILGLVPEGTARRTLEAYGASLIAEPDNVDAVSTQIEVLFEHWESGTLPEPDFGFVNRFDRKKIAGVLAGLLEPELILTFETDSTLDSTYDNRG